MQLVGMEEREHEFIPKQKYKFSDIAVLCRISSVLHEFHKSFKDNGIAVQLYGAKSLYERQEVLDIFAHLSLAIYPDDQAFKRIINKPKRGLGKTTINYLTEIKSSHRFNTLYEGLEYSVKNGFPSILQEQTEEKSVSYTQTSMLKYTQGGSDKEYVTPDQTTKILKKKSRAALQNFYNRIENIKKMAEKCTIHELVAFIAFETEYKEHLETLQNNDTRRRTKRTGKSSDECDSESDDGRKANVELIIQEAKIFETEYLSDKQSIKWKEKLQKFIDSCTLRSTDEEPVGFSRERNNVVLSTIHQTKGLEWPVVIVVRCNEGVMPIKNNSLLSIEDERKICFVALTRAKQEFIMTFCRKTNAREAMASRFLNELDSKCISFTEITSQMEDKSPELSEEELLEHITQMQPIHTEDNKNDIIKTQPQMKIKATQDSNKKNRVREQEINDCPPKKKRKKFAQEEEPEFDVQCSQSFQDIKPIVKDQQIKLETMVTKKNSEKKKNKKKVKTTSSLHAIAEQKALQRSSDVLMKWMKSASPAQQQHGESKSITLNFVKEKKNHKSKAKIQSKNPNAEKNQEITKLETILGNDSIHTPNKQSKEKTKKKYSKKKTQKLQKGQLTFDIFHDFVKKSQKHESAEAARKSSVSVLKPITLNFVKEEKRTEKQPEKQKAVTKKIAPKKLAKMLATKFSQSAVGVEFSLGQECDHCHSWISKQEIDEQLQKTKKSSICCSNSKCKQKITPQMSCIYFLNEQKCTENVKYFTQEKLQKLTRKLYQQKANLSAEELAKSHRNLFWNMLNHYGSITDATQQILRQ